MKQPDDKFTMDMFPTTPVGKYNYRFYVVTADDNGGEHCTEWRGLTKTRARQMHAYTTQSQPSNVIRHGWEECK
jgi:hypothetical protein